MNGHPTVIMKYYEQLDRFIRIRVASREEIQKALDSTLVTEGRVTKDVYLKWVVKTFVLKYESEILPAILDKFGPEYFEDVMVSLYQNVIDVNPRMEIHQIQIKIEGERPTSGPFAKQDEEPSLFDEPKAKETFREKLPRLKAELHRRIIGQREATDAVTSVVTRAAANIRDLDRPIGGLLFVGFTGTGKTEVAKATSAALFGHDRLVRVDCSEYSSPHEYSKILGSPPGYVGHESGSVFCDTLKENPESVVLFDEIEKADEKIYDLLLQVLEDGRLTTGKGELIDFTQALIIMTSNIGTREAVDAQSRAGFTHTTDQTGDTERLGFVQALEREMRPEFLNRVDRTVIFRQLDKGDAGTILDRMLTQFDQRVIDGTGGNWEVLVSQPARAHLVQEGFSRKYGARELRRTIQKLIEDPIAERLVAPGCPEKGSIQAYMRDDKMQIRMARLPEEKEKSVEAP